MNSFSIWHWMVILVVLVILLSPAVIGMMVMGTQRSVAIRHEPSGLLKKRFYGYSWTYLLFGFFVPVFCGEISIGLLHIILNIRKEYFRLSCCIFTTDSIWIAN
jgi:hypothetical protein